MVIFFIYFFIIELFQYSLMFYYYCFILLLLLFILALHYFSFLLYHSCFSIHTHHYHHKKAKDQKPPPWAPEMVGLFYIYPFWIERKNGEKCGKSRKKWYKKRQKRLNGQVWTCLDKCDLSTKTIKRKP